MSGWKQAEGAFETGAAPCSRHGAPKNRHGSGELQSKAPVKHSPLYRVQGDIMTYRIVAERDNETVRMDRASSLIALAKARIWASEGWDVTIIVGDRELSVSAEQELLLPA